MWTGAIGGSRYEYGRIGHDGKIVEATHVAIYLETGKWPEFQALHKCDNTLCVRFVHLFDGTQKQNMQDAAAKGHIRGNVENLRRKS
jgi:uncharacterized protein YeaC (DUF1315 family)